MKKLLTAAALTAMIGTAAQADILRVEMGAGIWDADPSGTLQYKDQDKYDVVDQLGYDSEQQTYAWVYFKHPVPLIPNVRLEYADLSYQGDATTTVDWGGSYPVNSVNELSMTQYDAILYYNLLDNTFWTTLDLGLDIKYIDAEYTIEDSSGTIDPYAQSESLVVPMVYLRSRVQIPATELGIEADVKYISYSGSKLYDFRIKADYTFDITPLVQPGIEVGYRVQKLDIDEDSFDAKVDIEFSGVYAGLMLRF